LTLRRSLVILAAAAWLGGCYQGGRRSFTPATFAREPGWVSVSTVPVISQGGEHDCGAAAVAMLLGFWGIPASQVDVRAASGAPPDRGLTAESLRAYLRGRGLEAYLFEGTFSDFEHELASGRPVLVGVVKPYSNAVYAHYQIVVGLNRGHEKVVVIDPADGWGVYSFDGFVREWKPTRFLTMTAFPGPP
jgi:ABC-type bacteriocin/lantibiotic exporter with double-glycine peptidase domain